MIAAIIPTEQKQAVEPLVQAYDLGSQQIIRAGEMERDYYGVPVWLMRRYLERLDVAAIGESFYQRGECVMQVSSAQRKRVGSLELGGAHIQFTGVAGDIQKMLTDLEWVTQRR